MKRILHARIDWLRKSWRQASTFCAFLGVAAFSSPLAPAADAPPTVTLFSLFANNMVLQRDMPVPVWGSAAAGEKVTVSFAGQKKQTVAGENGKWHLSLDPLKASASPQTMTVSASGGDQPVKVENILVGDVWVCSGQSNMRRPVSEVNGAAKEISEAQYPDIRFFEVPMANNDTPSLELTGDWRSCSPESVAAFSAVGYFFGRELYTHLDVPIGLVWSCVGGTPAEVWTPREVLESLPAFSPMFQAFAEQRKKYEADPATYKKELREWEKSAPSRLYNGMIHPLTSFAIKGVIWYQGEANTRNPASYMTLLPAMIKGWRTAWRQGDFPFMIVQLANYNDPRPKRNWAELREVQYLVSKTVSNTGLAVAVDIGEPENIHPLDKQDVGKRLALAARDVAYGEKDVIASGPVYDSMKIEGGKVRIVFSNIGGGLEAKGGELRTFTIAGDSPPAAGKALADGQFVEAKARIDGNSVIVWSEQIKDPVAVRYAWANNPEGCNLYNKEGLPAVPFRTDRPKEKE